VYFSMGRQGLSTIENVLMLVDLHVGSTTDSLDPVFLNLVTAAKISAVT
jgi:hypothetical protein